MEIIELDELREMLWRANWIESQLELAVQWEAYAYISEKYRDIIFKITHESQGHRITLNRLCKKLDGIDLENYTGITKIKEPELKFKHMTDQEMLSEIMKYENLALDIYKKLHFYSNRELIKKIWRGEEPEEYFKTLQQIIKDEERHICWLKPFVGKIERIM